MEIPFYGCLNLYIIAWMVGFRETGDLGSINQSQAQNREEDVYFGKWRVLLEANC